MYGVVLYTDDVQLLHGIFLIYDQCIYSPENRYTNIFSLNTDEVRATNKTLVYVFLRICMTFINLGIAITESSILYRYPPLVVPPPQEVCDFCLPLGGKLHRLNVENGRLEN